MKPRQGQDNQGARTKSTAATAAKDQKMTSDFYLVNVSREDRLLQRSDVSVEELEPLPLVADLVHVDVDRGDVLVPSLQTLVLFSTRFPKRNSIILLDEFEVSRLTSLEPLDHFPKFSISSTSSSANLSVTMGNQYTSGQGWAISAPSSRLVE